MSSNDIFAKLLEYTYDENIKALLKKFSKGKFIKGFTFENNNLIHGSSKIKVSKDVKQLFKVLNFIKKNSKKKIKAKKPWKNFRKEKSLLVSNYINRLKKQYDLTIEEKMKLFSLIEMCIFCKKINDKTIVFNENEISKISILNFDSDSRTFYLDL